MNQVKMRTTRCCICGERIKDDILEGNNPDPLKDENGNLLAENRESLCCHRCNHIYVVPYRLCLYYGQKEQCNLIQNKVLELRRGWKHD